MQFILALLVIFIFVCALSAVHFNIFRLGYIFIHNISQELVYINAFPANVPILYFLKTPGNQKASCVFWGYKIGTATKNGLIKFIISRRRPAYKISLYKQFAF